jgi:Protein of unknown function (DUF3313)
MHECRSINTGNIRRSHSSTYCSQIVHSLLIVIIVASCLGGCGISRPINEQQDAGENLLKIASSDFDQAYINPDFDISRYREIYVTDLQIEFERNWVNNQNLGDPFRITDRNIELIEKTLRANFRQSMERGLTQNSQLRIVATPGQDTLWLRPAILQLNISNPDNLQAYQTVTLAEIAATMTIVLELAAPANGKILVRLSDRGRTRDYLRFSQQDVVKNQSDIGKLFFDWAAALGSILSSTQPAGETQR